MKKNMCYPLSLLVERQLVMKASITQCTWTWHKMLGHLHFRGQKQMRDKDMVHGLPQLEEQSGVCEGCQFGKQHRLSFPKGQALRASVPLELIHVDLCGPMRNECIAGNKYFMLLIDDSTRMIWVYFLRNKSEAFNCFKKFKSMTELQSRHKVKCLRSDRGGEFLSFEFIKFCEDHGIQRCPTKALNNVTPFEAYSGRKPGIAHLKVFGSLCYVHVLNELRHKLEPKSVKGVFVGYATCEKEHYGKAVTPFPNESLSEHGFVIGDNDISSEERNTQAYDHSPLKWRRLDDVLAQCNLCIIEPENYAEAAQDKSWLKAMEDVKGPAPNFPKPETNPVEFPTSPRCWAHLLKTETSCRNFGRISPVN
ncbi:hypothetical protein L3X38_043288 [Prunus dulcis]|uniref:Integrase catalytic domain-containing protein n=1 Tax=Prunus dulcis TaxID=3755 RepID=A0AAD4UY65_PRUDU|nr:hypothetical protein L3X38_043288 [Prunus dulcis]